MGVCNLIEDADAYPFASKEKGVPYQKMTCRLLHPV